MKFTRLPFLMLLGLLLSLGHVAFADDPSRNFAQWEPAIKAFERADRTNPPPKGALLFIGSSTIRFWSSLSQDFPKYPIINRGFGGSQIVDATHFADRIVIPYAPSMIFFRSGGNDLWAGKTPEQVFADFKDFVTKVHAQLPATKIVYISLSPSIARWKQEAKEKHVNELVAAYIQTTPNLEYIDTWTVPLDAQGQPRPELFRVDKLHFNAAGYLELAKRVRPFLPPQPPATQP